MGWIPLKNRQHTSTLQAGACGCGSCVIDCASGLEARPCGGAEPGGTRSACLISSPGSRCARVGMPASAGGVADGPAAPSGTGFLGLPGTAFTWAITFLANALKGAVDRRVD
jgi:hypothetical protein